MDFDPDEFDHDLVSNITGMMASGFGESSPNVAVISLSIKPPQT
jgi:hypothetical protein